MFFHVFLRLDFGIEFWQNFWRKKAPKWPPKSIPGATRSTKKALKISARFPPDRSWSRPFFGQRVFYVFWSTFGVLLVNVGPFWLHLGPFGVHVGPFWLHFGSFLDAPGWFLQEINRIWNRYSQAGFSQRIWSQNEKRKQTRPLLPNSADPPKAIERHSIPHPMLF